VNEIVLKSMILNIDETDELRRKWASSLKTYRLQDQLKIDKLGASYKTFLIKFRDSSCGSEVPLPTRFQNEIFFIQVNIRSKNLCTKV
jgi:hypothetical protein